MSNISQLLLDREKAMLSEFAFFTSQSRGREVEIPPCQNRTAFQRDRDRIIHSKSFRRLMHKTQVFLSPVDEHYRTRLTHTLEVTQIARIMARALRLNEDLTEAIALGHDLGHTPFGHAGEDALRMCYDPKFAHNEQSLRVVESIERDGRGLNLTWEVRDGIVNHTGARLASTLEGILVKYADRIAYINHDIDDACRAGVLCMEDIPRDILDVLGDRQSSRINTMVAAIIDGSLNQPAIIMTKEVEEAMLALRQFLFANVYRNPIVKGEDDKAKQLLIQLFEYFKKYPEKMPATYSGNIDRDGVDRCVCDFIAGMTDRYAVRTYESIFMPEVWGGNN